MHKKLLLIIVFSFSLLLFCGCTDTHEVDDLAHVFSIGIDRGISNKWRLTVQVFTMKEGGSKDQSSGGGGSEKEGSGDSGGTKKQEQDGYATITIDAPSFFGGISMINSILSRRLNFMHAKFLVISEDLAKGGLAGEYMAPIARYRQIRRNTHVLISKKSAKEFIENNKPFFGKALSKSMELLIQESKTTGFIPDVTLDDFYDDIKSFYNQPIAILASPTDDNSFKEEGELWGDIFKSEGDYVAGEVPKSGGNTVELFGTAVFDGDTMVGELNGDETRLMLMARGEFKRGFFTIQDPKVPELIIPLDVRPSRKPKIKVQFKDDIPIINLKINLEGDLLAVQSGINYESNELKPLLESTFEQYIKNMLDELIEKCQKLNTDVFKFGGSAVRHFATIEEWEKYNWIKQFEKAEVNTEVDFVIRRTGSMMRTSSIINKEGKE